MKLESISKIYNLNKKEIIILENVDYEFENGKFYAITGKSGSGKSTLINILGLLENITDGKYIINGKNITKLNDSESSNLRKEYFGFIFQDFNLDDQLFAYENVMIPMLINNKIKDKKERAIDLLNKLDLSERINHYPRQLSGGEKQRVAIARALANNPKVILADEPTGNLDSENEEKIFKILKQLSKDGKCIIVVSHSKEVKKYADVVLKINNKRLCVDNEY